MLESIITSKTRLNLLIKFFVNIANKGYLNSLASEFGESTNSVRKELNNLTDAGYLNRTESNNKVVTKVGKWFQCGDARGKCLQSWYEGGKVVSKWLQSDYTLFTKGEFGDKVVITEGKWWK